MDTATRNLIMQIFDCARDLTVATVRPDGYPQATTVSFAHEGMTIYVGIGKHSQKAENIRRCNKVSLSVNLPYSDWNHIKGLSIGGTARISEDPAEIARATQCMLKRFPEAAALMESNPKAEMALLAIHPEVISVLDYQKGFGHTDLVSVD